MGLCVLTGLGAACDIIAPSLTPVRSGDRAKSVAVQRLTSRRTGYWHVQQACAAVTVESALFRSLRVQHGEGGWTMVRLLASAVLHLLANAVGLLIASLVLSGFSVTPTAFVIAVLIFTVIEVVLDPLIVNISLQYAPALRGGVALATTLVGLVATTLITDGLTISGLTAWVVGTLIVWLGGVLAALVLPLVLFRSVLREGEGRR
jgi:hypothetical protein